MDPDTQFAESVKYSRALILVPCPSGRWAIFSNGRQLIGWADPTTCMEDLPEPIEIRQPRPIPRNNADELDLEIIL